MNTKATNFRADPPDGRTARWESHRQARRVELLHQARKAVHRRGPNVSMDDIAETAGTSKSVFYRYFGDKSGLQAALAELISDEMVPMFTTDETEGTSPAEGMRSMVHSYLAMAAASPNVYFFVTERISGVTDSTDSFAGLFATLEEQFSIHYRRHLSAVAPDFTPDELSWLWPKAAIGLVRATGEAWLAEPKTDQTPDLTAMTDRITEWLLLGLSRQQRAPKEVK